MPPAIPPHSWIVAISLLWNHPAMPHAQRATADLAPIRYTLRFPKRAQHLIDVEAIMPTDGRASIELMMPVWTPGSYLVREYARQVEGLEARSGDGAPLAIEKTRKNRWKIATAGAPEIVVRYRVYAREMSVQGNWVDRSFAMMNGAATFLTLADERAARPHDVVVDRPADWKHVITGLSETAEPHAFRADDFDTLVDCPIYAGNAAVYEFKVDGKPHLLVNEGEAGIWDGPRSARDVEAIVKAQRDFWGSLPYDKYIFFNILSETGGGLEHKNSTLLMASRWATRKRSSYLAWLNLVSHEFFHTWNVKRMRPVELGPFDYENEVHTPSLWIAEGITSYYDRLFVRRAGLCTVEEFLAGDPPSGVVSEDKSKTDIERLQETPGRLAQPLERASYDAWIKFYRRDENTANTAISYYVKGSVVAWLLDAKIRAATAGAKCLDDVMRLAYQRHSGARGFTAAEFQHVVSEIAGVDLTAFFQDALTTTNELDYREALDWFGLRFAEERPDQSKGESGDEPRKGWLGLEAKAEVGRLFVTSVKRGSPAYDAGVNVGDELIAIGDLRIPPEQWSKRLALLRPDERVGLLIARRERLERIEVTLAAEPKSQWKLEIAPTPTAEQTRNRKSWLEEK